MAAYEAFSYPLCVRHKAYYCSKTTLFYLLTTFLPILFPFVFIYSQGFWKEVEIFQEQPDIAFKHKMLLLLETDRHDNYIFWSTYQNINFHISSDFQQSLPLIKHIEEDYNRDGKFDELIMTIDVPILRRKIFSLKLILIFDFKLHLHSEFQMECAALISRSSSLPGSNLYLAADLKLFQREPLEYSVLDLTHNVSVINEKNEDMSSDLKLENILMNYAKRNISTVLKNDYYSWKSGQGESLPFTISINIKYPNQFILYKVPVWQQIKWFFVQYITYFAIFHSIFYYIKLYVFKKQLVPSIVIHTVPSTKME